ncbi:hypothetical protein Lfu02_14930 [Longispora fulva]|uniref:hypothetical protein n=1 Tax=Longispora fulva TaxID=619741 RepID=UPI001A3F28EB|nr:hypothetical protein Lfu02_14930 [Longispora fulva]
MVWMVVAAALIAVAALAVPALDRRATRHAAERQLRELVPADWGVAVADGVDTLIGWRLDQPAATDTVLTARARANGWTAQPCGPPLSCWVKAGYRLTVESPCRPGLRACRLRVAISWSDPWIRDALAFPATVAVLLVAAGGRWARLRRRPPPASTSISSSGGAVRPAVIPSRSRA